MLVFGGRSHVIIRDADLATEADDSDAIPPHRPHSRYPRSRSCGAVRRLRKARKRIENAEESTKELRVPLRFLRASA